jgi:hypothetical protein
VKCRLLNHIFHTQRGQIMTARKTLLTLTLVAVAAISTNAPRAQSNVEPGAQGGMLDVLENLRTAQAQRLEGSWALTVNAAPPPGAPSLPARTSYMSFARGGVALLYERQAAFVNPAYGAWEHRGANEFAFTVVSDAFNPLGNFVGTIKIRNKLILTGPDEFVSVGHLEAHDPAGNLLFSGCATARGRRIKVEPLPEQCRSVTPPQ